MDDPPSYKYDELSYAPKPASAVSPPMGSPPPMSFASPLTVSPQPPSTAPSGQTMQLETSLQSYKAYPNYHKHRQIFIMCGIATLIICGRIVKKNLFTAPNNMHNASASDDMKLSRQQARGTVASIITAFLFAVVNGTVDYYGGVDPAASTALVGMTFGGTIGFVLDNAMGSDEGWRLWQEQGFKQAWKYGMGCLVTGRYGRYVITVLFDMFLSLILFDPIYSKLKSPDVSPFFADVPAAANFIVSSVLGLTTFQAYANITRFAWAYPSLDAQDTSEWISGSNMQVMVSIASLLYFVSKDGTGLQKKENKIAIVIGTWTLMWALSSFGVMQARPNVRAVSDNVRIVKAPEGTKEGDVLQGSLLTDTTTQSQLEGEFRVVEKQGDDVFKVIRIVASHKLLIEDNSRVPELISKSSTGAMGVLALGAATGGAVLFGIQHQQEGKKTKTLFACYMLLCLILASPAMSS